MLRNIKDTIKITAEIGILSFCKMKLVDYECAVLSARGVIRTRNANLNLLETKNINLNTNVDTSCLKNLIFCALMALTVSYVFYESELIRKRIYIAEIAKKKCV